MKHIDCKNYIFLDCEKGMCALSKLILPIDGEGSEACPMFVTAEQCGCCVHFKNADARGMGMCVGFEKESWSYATCGASACEQFEMSK